MFSTARLVLITSVALAALVLPGCSDDDDEADDTAPSTSEAAAPTPDTSASADDSSGSGSSTASPGGDSTTSGDSTQSTTPSVGDTGCWVHLYDEDRFDERDPHFQLSEPGRYPDMAALPGAAEDWTDQADSIRVGPDATVTIWPQTDFGGRSQVLEPGSEHPDVAEEPMSIELRC